MSGVCRFFNSKGGCKNGKRCRFQHVIESSAKVCRHFAASGACLHGHNCHFLHQEPVVSTFASCSSFQALADPVSPTKSITEQSIPVISVDECVANAPNDDDALVPESTDTAQSSSLLGSLAAKKKSKKRKSKKNGAKSGESGSKGKELILVKKHIIKCGECNAVFNAGPSNPDNWNALKAHYVDKFGRNDAQHVQMLRKHSGMFECNNDITCWVCSSEFMRLSDLFQHLASKSQDVDELVSLAHRSHFETIVLPFVERDVGFVGVDSVLLKRVRSLTRSWNAWDDDTESDMTDEIPAGFPSMLAYFLARQAHRNDNDTDESDYEGGMFGFSSGDCNELLCQGIKPWDPEAGAALMVLNGYVDY